MEETYRAGSIFRRRCAYNAVVRQLAGRFPEHGARLPCIVRLRVDGDFPQVTAQIAYIGHFIERGSHRVVEQMFDRFLRDSPHVELWQTYVDYVQYDPVSVRFGMCLCSSKMYQVGTEGS